MKKDSQIPTYQTSIRCISCQTIFKNNSTSNFKEEEGKKIENCSNCHFAYGEGVTAKAEVDRIGLFWEREEKKLKKKLKKNKVN